MDDGSEKYKVEEENASLENHDGAALPNIYLEVSDARTKESSVGIER